MNQPQASQSRERSAVQKIAEGYALHVLSLLTCIVAYVVTNSIRPVVRDWDWKEFLLLCGVFSTVVFVFQAVVALFTGISVIKRATVIYGFTAIIVVLGLLINFFLSYLIAAVLFFLGLGLLATSAQNPGKLWGYILCPVPWGVGLWLNWKHFLSIIAIALVALLMMAGIQVVRGQPLISRRRVP